MIAHSHTILVTGITGHQGGAAARHLLDRGFNVRGLTRNTDKEDSQQLIDAGIDMVQGDMDDRDSLDMAMRSVQGVFSVQDPWVAGVDGEVRFARNLADAALQAAVQHFVQASVASADRDTGIPHFESKHKIEKYINDIGLACTILRPVFFMDNWQMPMLRDAIAHGMLPQPLQPETRLQQIDVDDIGLFAAMAFENPDKWIGRTVELAGDELSMRDTADIFSRVIGKEVKYTQVAWDEFEKTVGREMAIMYRWFEDIGYAVDIEACRREHPGLKTLEHAQ
jgi:uncharacterized protein YbjT (DUF2867 family)